MQGTDTDNPTGWERFFNNGRAVYLLFWAITMVLYFPAAKAGWVIDAAGWLYSVQYDDFWSYINRTHSTVESLYQFTQFSTYVLYKIWGANVWAWSVLYISLHAANAYLLFSISRKLFQDSGVQKGLTVALCGALLFCCSPYVSEVLNWKACYHYLQGFLLLLLIFKWVVQFQSATKARYAWLAGVVFFISVFSLEIFYLAPLFVVAVAVYYRYVLNGSAQNFRNTLKWFLLPQLLSLAVYFITFFVLYKSFRPHVHNVYSQDLVSYLSKPVKYVYHILFLGRFFSPAVKDKVYAICEQKGVLISFYGLFIGAAILLVSKLGKRQGWVKPALILLFLVMITMALLMPLPFPASSLLVFYDRYCYFTCGFVYLLLALLLISILGKRPAIIVLVLFGGAGLYFTVRLNLYWKQSAYVNNRLLKGLPDPGNKTIILLDLPENMMGAPMIGADPDGEFKALYELFNGKKISNQIYDAMSFNMNSQEEGAHVTVVNDTLVRVTLNQWGTWWWYQGHGGKSYANEAYKLDLVDGGHMYELTLKHPKEQYMLLYMTAANWKTVDMTRKNEDQY